MDRVSSKISIQSNSEDLLDKMVSTFDGKGQIKNWATERVKNQLEAYFGKLDFIEKLQSRFGTKSAKIRQQEAFTRISELVSRSNVTNGQVLLSHIKNKMMQEGKLRGRGVANTIRRFQQDADQKIAQPGMFVPYGQKFAPRSGGVHFLKDDPLTLNAARIIVPASMASSNGLVPAEEDKADQLGANDGSTRLVGMQEKKVNPGETEKFTKGEVRSRYANILGHCSGAVVISPLSFDKNALNEMFLASLEACRKNQHLTITFAIPNTDGHLENASTIYAMACQEFEKLNESKAQ